MAVTPDVPDAARALIWHEFFASRGRGLGWDEHLGWTRNQLLCCAHASVGGDGVAALLVRSPREAAIGMVGYVCTHGSFRSRGLVRHLLQAVVDSTYAEALHGLVLWTQVPAVYQSSKFAVTARDTVYHFTGSLPADQCRARIDPWLDSNDGCASLPPYATAGWRAQDRRAEIIFADTIAGATLLGHVGDASAIMRLMARARQAQWRATLPDNDPLAAHLVSHRLVTAVAPGPYTMCRPVGQIPTRIPPIPVFDRI